MSEYRERTTAEKKENKIKLYYALMKRKPREKQPFEIETVFGKAIVYV